MLSGMLELYKATDPLVTALWAAGGFALLCWVLSILTKEYSWVDRLWSITPALFAVHFAAYVGFTDLRLNLMAGLAVLWGVRLTYNFARKSGYKVLYVPEAVICHHLEVENNFSLSKSLIDHIHSMGRYLVKDYMTMIAMKALKRWPELKK